MRPCHTLFPVKQPEFTAYNLDQLLQPYLYAFQRVHSLSGARIGISVQPGLVIFFFFLQLGTIPIL